MSLQKNRTIFTLLSLSCLIFPAAALGQSSAKTTQSGSDKNQQQNSTPKNKQKSKNPKRDSKKGDDSRRPMDERAPIPRQPGKMDTPTLPQRTPGQQPTPGSADPTSPTTTKPQ